MSKIFAAIHCIQSLRGTVHRLLCSPDVHLPSRGILTPTSVLLMARSQNGWCFLLGRMVLFSFLELISCCLRSTACADGTYDNAIPPPFFFFCRNTEVRNRLTFGNPDGLLVVYAGRFGPEKVIEV